MALLWMCMIYFTFMFDNVSGKEDIWYTYQFVSGHGNREELVISKVEAVRDFNTEKVATSWRTLSLKHKSYALGLTENGVIALQAVLDSNGSGNIVTNSSHIGVTGRIIDASLFEHWNNSIYTNDIIAVLAIKNNINNDVQLRWFKFTNNNELIQIWKFDWKKNVTHFNIFKIEENWHILICNERYENYTTADLYRFSLQKNPDFWLIHAIQLITPTRSSAVSNYGLDTYLSIPQSDWLFVYRYDTSYFESKWNLTARNVHYVTAFKIGFQAFLAVDGSDAGIYKFSDSGFVRQDIQDANLNGLDYWMSIPVRNYRDEEILIAERSLDHDSHRTFAIEAVLYNGGKFMVHDEMECHYYGTTVHGMNCFVDEENSVGMKGSAYLAVGDVLGVLVPRNHTTSRLFTMYTRMKEIESPLHKQIEILNSFKERLQQKIEDRKSKIKNLANSLKHSIKPNEENIISEPWKVGILAAPALQKTNDAVFNIPEQTNLQNLLDRVADIKNSIADININLPLIKPIGTRNKFETLIVNGPVEVHGESNIQTLETADFNDGFDFGDYVRVDDARRISSQKLFSNIVVESLSFEKVNGINKDQLLFDQMDPIEVHGDIVFEGDVTVLHDVTTTKINDGDIIKELVSVGKKYKDTISFENLKAIGSIEVEAANKFPIHNNYLDAIDPKHDDANIERDELESLFVPGNITVENINGENLQDLIYSLSLRNIESYVPNETKISGDIQASNSEVRILNGLKFSSEYITTDADKFSLITGKKVFTNEIRIKELTTPGKINGIDTNKIVTLSDNQTIFGKFTFDQLRIIGEFKLSENINFGIDTSSLNPTLLEASEISVNCSFKDLEVDGMIIVDNRYNDINFERMLSDVVYKTDPVADISSIKDFGKGLTIRNNLNLKSNAINNEPIENFIDKEREQIMEMKTLNGNVTFKNLILLGNFGEVNISKLSQEAVRTSGDQFITSELIFEDEITVNHLNITKTLNEIECKDFLFTDGSRVLDDVAFDSVEVHYLIIKGNLNSTKQKFDLEEYGRRRLSSTNDQFVTGTVYVQTSKIEDLKPDLINNYSFKDMFDVDAYGEKVGEILESKKMKIKEMIIEDSLDISKIGNISINEILKNCIWTEEKGFRPNLILRNNVEFNSIELDLLNSVNFSEIMNSLIYKNETDVEFTGPKIFVHGYEVLNYISTPTLNGKRVENILRKGGEQSINSELWINGDVLIDSDFELQTLNNVSLDDVTTLFKVVDSNTYNILGHVDFTRVSRIKELVLESNINGENANDFFNSIVDIKEDKNFTLDVRFEKPVIIAANLAANVGINGIDIANIKENIVFLTQDASVEGVVIFEEDVSLSEMIEVEQELSGPLVMNCNLQNWRNDSVFINVGKISGVLHFNESFVENNIITNQINEVDVKSCIPLRTDETIPLDLCFSELSSFNDIVVNDFVNGRKLNPEFYNSVLSGQIQEITSNVIFEGNVLVHSELDVLGPINGHDLSNIVTLNTIQNLNATYEFTNRTTISGNLLVYGEINGINITQWMNNNVKKYSPIKQTITKPWAVQNSLTFGNNVIGNGTIGSLDLRIVADQVEERRLFKNHMEIQLIDQFKTICNDINGIVAASKKQIFLFEYLETQKILDFQYTISNIHHIEFQDFNYMLVTDDTSCFSELFAWNGTGFSSVKLIETGKIKQMITVRDGDYVFLVSRHGRERTICNVEGVNVWKFSIDNITPLLAIDDCTYLQESVVPGGFYTMDSDGVSEYKLLTASETNIFKVRRWNVDTAKAAFIPRGLNLGLALRNGRQVMKLSRADQISQDDLGFNYNSVIVGNVTWEENYYLPGRDDGEMLIMNVGYPRRKTLIAVSSQEKTTVKGEFDVIKVFNNIRSGSLFHKIPCSEPSSLLSLEFGDNGETLLVFLEGNERLKIYEYKGIEGYKQRLSVTIQGSKLVQMILPYGANRKPRNFIGVINKTHLSILQAVMEGDQMIDESSKCNL